MGFVLFTFSGLLYEFHDVPCHLSSHAWTSACCAFETKWCHLQPSVHHAWSPISASTTALTQNLWPQWVWTTLDDSGVNYGKLVIVNHSRAFQNYHSGYIILDQTCRKKRSFFLLAQFFCCPFRKGSPWQTLSSRRFTFQAAYCHSVALAGSVERPLAGEGRCCRCQCAINRSSTAGLGEGNHRISRTKPTQSICTHIIGWHEFGYID